MSAMSDVSKNDELMLAARESLARALASETESPLLEATKLLSDALARDPAFAEVLQAVTEQDLSKIIELELRGSLGFAAPSPDAATETH
jgi:hypothetical protein